LGVLITLKEGEVKRTGEEQWEAGNTKKILPQAVTA
jgi:hypothetical protein